MKYFIIILLCLCVNGIFAQEQPTRSDELVLLTWNADTLFILDKDGQPLHESFFIEKQTMEMEEEILFIIFHGQKQSVKLSEEYMDYKDAEKYIRYYFID